MQYALLQDDLLLLYGPKSKENDFILESQIRPKYLRLACKHTCNSMPNPCKLPSEQRAVFVVSSRGGPAPIFSAENLRTTG